MFVKKLWNFLLKQKKQNTNLNQKKNIKINFFFVITIKVLNKKEKQMFKINRYNFLFFLQMPRVQFIGQVSLSYGNTLPELCSKLKNFGVGRMFVRTTQDQNKGKILLLIIIFKASVYRSILCCFNTKSSSGYKYTTESNHW